MEWVEWIARFLSFWLDRIVYGFISVVYNLFTDIAQTTIFSDDIFSPFSQKIYALLGIFMLFKVSFSILTYIVDPDSFLDKSKGFSKLIGNIVITLGLLVLTPWIFSQAMDIQRIVLKNNILGKLFSSSSNTTIIINDYGNVMAYETLQAFYHIDSESYPNCSGDMYDNIDGIRASVTNCVDSITFSNSDNVSKDNIVDTLVYSYNTNSVNVYMDSDLLFLKDSNDNYVMSYLPILSTLAGGAIVLLLIVFCFDVAVRSIKLGFLRMLAPVPIISRIDPKKGKETFDKWLKVCISTYLDLFIRLLAIYFAIFVVTQVINSSFVDSVTKETIQVNAFVKVFIILGALLFAKQLPKL